MKNLITHNSIPVKNTFEEFTTRLEALLGYFDHVIMDKVKDEPAEARSEIEKMRGQTGMMLFSMEDHGVILLMEGEIRKAKQYRIGNPLIAMTMTKLDVRAGLYVPLSVMIYEDNDGLVLIDYDLPSSLLGQFGNQEITKIGESLDQKLEELIDLASN